MSDPSYINFEILRIGKIITLFHLELVYLNCFYKYVTTTEFLKFMYLHNISLLFSVFRFLQYNELRTIGGFEPRRSTVVSEVDRQSRFKILSNRRWKNWRTFKILPNLWPILKTIYARNMGYFQVRYDSKVVNYDRRGRRLATGHTESDAPK